MYHSKITQKQEHIEAMTLPETLDPKANQAEPVPQTVPMCDPLVPQMSNMLPQMNQAWQQRQLVQQHQSVTMPVSFH